MTTGSNPISKRQEISTEEAAKEAADYLASILSSLSSEIVKSTPHAGDRTGEPMSNMNWDLMAKRSPIVLAICGVISIWAAPSIWLHEELRETKEVVISNSERLNNVEKGLSEVKAGQTRLEGKVDQLIFHLLDGQP